MGRERASPARACEISSIICPPREAHLGHARAHDKARAGGEGVVFRDLSKSDKI